MSTDLQDPRFAHQGLADSESYVRRQRPSARKYPMNPRALMSGEALVTVAPEPVEPPSSVPVITEEIKQETLRRIKAGAKNTLVTINADGTRSYKHDFVNRGDGMHDLLSTDRGEGSKDSLDLLAKDLAAPAAKGRDSSGKFTKGK